MNITHCITDGEGNIDHVDALFRGWERVQQAEFIPLQCPSPVAHRMAAPQTAPRGGALWMVERCCGPLCLSPPPQHRINLTLLEWTPFSKNVWMPVRALGVVFGLGRVADQQLAKCHSLRTPGVWASVC